MAIIPGDIKKGVSIETPQQQKTKKLVTILVVVVLITIVVVYFGLSGSSPSAVPSINTDMMTGQINSTEREQINQSNKLLDSLSKTELNNTVFKNKKFEIMTLSDRLPVVVGEKGRSNPFIPF